MSAHGAPTTSRRRSRWVRLQVLLAVGLLCGTGATTSLASWTDQGQVGATFTAATVPAPEMTRDCRIVRGLLGPTHVEIYWRLPDGADLEDVLIETSTNGLGSVLEPVLGFGVADATTTNPDGSYTTRVPTGLLGGALGLFSSLEVGVTVDPHPQSDDWRSTTARVEANLGLALGIGAFCRVAQN